MAVTTRLFIRVVLLVTVTIPAFAQSQDDDLLGRAHALAQDAIIVDGHIDLPYRLTRYDDDVTGATLAGDFDFVRARAGGLDAPFMSIYIPAALQETGGARAFADSLIDVVEGLVDQAPDRFAIARSVADVRRLHAERRVALPLGMENGAPIATLDDLRHFHRRGIRYVTLTHARANELSDSSYDSTRIWNGLSPFGEEVVREMNRLGIMVDVSHLSDSAFYDVLDVSEAPVIASHSSARHFTPDWERNMSDSMIRDLAEHDGVIMINFGSSFLRTEYQEEGRRVRGRIEARLEAVGLDPDSPEGAAFVRSQRRTHPVGTLADVVDHIDHVVALVGVDHVGLGSDYDGVFALPAGLQDASTYPNLVAALLQRGYSDNEVRQILGESALRVWSEVERVASEKKPQRVD